MREFHLHCEADGKCALKRKGEEATLRFTDILQAMEHLKATKSKRGSTLTVYDPQGRVTFQDLL